MKAADVGDIRHYRHGGIIKSLDYASFHACQPEYCAPFSELDILVHAAGRLPHERV
jgi:hypothetical protein